VIKSKLKPPAHHSQVVPQLCYALVMPELGSVCWCEHQLQPNTCLRVQTVWQQGNNNSQHSLCSCPCQLTVELRAVSALAKLQSSCSSSTVAVLGKIVSAS
jgi:hypothetical protein